MAILTTEQAIDKLIKINCILYNKKLTTIGNERKCVSKSLSMINKISIFLDEYTNIVNDGLLDKITLDIYLSNQMKLDKYHKYVTTINKFEILSEDDLEFVLNIMSILANRDIFLSSILTETQINNIV